MALDLKLIYYRFFLQFLSIFPESESAGFSFSKLTAGVEMSAAPVEVQRLYPRVIRSAARAETSYLSVSCTTFVTGTRGGIGDRLVESFSRTVRPSDRLV